MVAVGTISIVDSIINVANAIINVVNVELSSLPNTTSSSQCRKIPSYSPPVPLADPARWLLKEITSPIRRTPRQNSKTQLAQLQLPFRKSFPITITLLHIKYE